jgi:tol-pal system protein YbgF
MRRLTRAVLAFVLVAGGPALAGDRDALRIDVTRLAQAAGAARQELAQAGGDPSRLAALEVRLTRLEEELRNLTGRIEEAEHRGSQLAARFDRLLADVDARLRAGGPAGASSGEPSGVAAGQTAAALPAPPRQPTLPAPGEPAAAAPAEGGYERGLDLLQAGRWADAETAFTGFVQASPDDPRAPMASYWLAETYYFRKDYPTAAAVFARNYRTYGAQAPRAPDNLLKLGMSLAALGDRERACQTFAEMVQRHPEAPAPVRQALERERANNRCG